MSKFKVLLVYPNLQMVMLLPPNIAILSAYLKKHGIEVKIFDTTLYRTAEKSVDDVRVDNMQVRPFNLKEKGVDYKKTDVFEDFRQCVSEYRPDLIGVAAADDTYELGMKLVSEVRHLGIHVVVGGVYPTFSPEETIRNPLVDSICIGEGEDALLELCLKMHSGEAISGIKNIWVKINGKVHKNELRKPVDIGKLPYDDFSIFEEKRFFRPMQGKVYKMVPITIDRGCPFNCAFCAAPLQRRLYLEANRTVYFRMKSVARIMDEVKYYIAEYGADYIYFNSETFFARGEEELNEFARRYSNEVRLPFWCQTRIETITSERIKMLEEMNCDRISIGLEHGNEEFRKKVLKKEFTNRQVMDAFRLLEKSSIPVTVNNIIGFPEETRELAFDTIKLNRSIRADSINAYYFTPYSGTPLRSYCIDKGYYRPSFGRANPMTNPILDMPQFPAEEIKGLVRTFPLYVKMPETYFEKIRIAERRTDEGEKAFAELRDIYFKTYFK